MTILINATTSNTGLIMSPDSSGAIQFQSNGVNTVAISNAGSLSVGSTFVANSTQVTVANVPI